jgi:hypothetical protein
MSDFRKDLQYSHEASEDPMWEHQIYPQWFSNLQSVNNHKLAGDHQFMGIDKTIVLSNGKTYYIDEKVRRTDYGDILLEVWSSEERRTPGWIQKPLIADYIAYAVLENGKAYLLPVQQLQEAWRQHGEQWKAEYGVRRAYTKLKYDRRYCSVSVPVPVNKLYQAIGGCLRCDFDPIGESICQM